MATAQKDKVATTYQEKGGVSERGFAQGEDLERVPTVFDDNYDGLHFWTVMVYFALCLIYFIELFNVTSSGAFSRNIAESIGGTDKTVWLTQAIVITTAVLGPPVSQATDFWGRKIFLVSSTIFGFVGAIILSRSNSFDQVIAGQVISSVSYIAQPILTAVASEILPRKYRQMAQGGLNAAGGIGGIVGLLGGISLTNNSPFGWRKIWYIVTALNGFSGIVIFALYKPRKLPLQSLSFEEKIRRLDWVAFILLGIGLILFCMGLSWGDSPYPWNDAHVVACLVIGAVFLIALVLHQTFIQKHGLIDHDFFKKDRNCAVALGCFFVDGMLFFSANDYFPFQMSVLYPLPALRQGARLIINMLAAVFATFCVLILYQFTKRIREPLVFAFLCYLIFFILMATSTLDMNTNMWAYPIFMGFGLGWTLTYLVTAAQMSAPAHLIATISGILLAIRSFGASIALGIYNAIFNSTLSKSLAPNIAKAVLPLGLPESSLGAFIGALAADDTADLFKIPGVTPQIAGAGGLALQKSYENSFKWVWVCAACLSGVTMIASAFILNSPKDFNNHVDAPLEGDGKEPLTSNKAVTS